MRFVVGLAINLIQPNSMKALSAHMYALMCSKCVRFNQNSV